MPLNANALIKKGIIASSWPAPATGITYVGGDVGSVNGTSIALTLPGGYAANDVAVIHAHGDRGSADISVSGETYTEELDENNSTGRLRRYGVFTRVLTASETNPTVDFSVSDFWGATITVYRGVDTTTPLDAAITKSNGENSATTANAGITTVTNNAGIVLLGGWTDNEITGIVAPTGTTLAQEYDSAGGSEQHNNVGAAYILDSGTAGAQTFNAWQNTGTIVGTDYSLLTVALRPA